MRRAPVIALLLVALVAAVALAPNASASRTTAVVPNGTYGVLGPRGEYVIFVVRDRKVRNLNFNIQITCQASDSPISEQRFFSAGLEAPQGRRIADNGKLILNWQERGNGRLGQVHVELEFGVRDVANFAVIVPEEPSPEPVPGEALESCDGVSALRFHRGFELTPIP
ncbi:MAG TPA: hypothetical protein VH275_01360 [Solirubrobacterales bacterium]|jgi:hypothetical protein|nr:hypothetical protein [Solirubrobacterales bacterium]